jgi:peptidyl-prolyl cis-trans isomerase B (cyclophilin B)
MKKIKILLCVVLVLISTEDLFSEIRHRSFSKKEIEKMSRTRAIIETKFGNIELRFFPEVAPNHVYNFITLAKKGFYDGTVFHRVIPKFLIQGGKPNPEIAKRLGFKNGRPPYTLKAEFNNMPHKRGTLSMARGKDPDSAFSQFFICVEDAPWLDKQYTVFGEVVSGMEVVDKISRVPRDRKDRPYEPVTIKIRIIEPPQ